MYEKSAIPCDWRGSALCEILGRIQRHFAGRVVTLVAATAFSALVSVALLSLTTRHLGPGDYGAYGLLMSIVFLVGAAADGGASLLVPAHYEPASSAERARLFITLAIFACNGASTAGLVLIVLWLCLSDPLIPLTAVVLSAVVMPMRAITNITGTIFSVTGAGRALAAQMAIQSLVVFLSTLAALFAFNMGGTSLFIGSLCGQFAALCTGLVALGRHQLLALPSRQWISRAAGSAPTTAVSALADGTRGFGETAFLTSALGLEAVGILGHARLYHGLVTAFGNSVRHNLWAKSLEEARNPQSSFEATRRAWTPIQIAITCAGIIFAFGGKEIVSIISNEKFSVAAAYIPALIVIALIQTIEQPANAIVCAGGRAASATWARTIMALGSLIVLPPAIFWFGIQGVVATCAIEAVAYRLYLRILASRERKVPFQDQVAVFGSLAIIAETAYVHWAVPSLIIRIILMSLGIGILLVIGQRWISEMMSAAHQIVLGDQHKAEWRTS